VSSRTSEPENSVGWFHRPPRFWPLRPLGRGLVLSEKQRENRVAWGAMGDSSTRTPHHLARIMRARMARAHATREVSRPRVSARARSLAHYASKHVAGVRAAGKRETCALARGYGNADRQRSGGEMGLSAVGRSIFHPHSNRGNRLPISPKIVPKLVAAPPVATCALARRQTGSEIACLSRGRK